MNENTLFELTLFDPENTLVAGLNKRGIAFRKVPVTRQFVVAMDETVEIISTDSPETLIENLVSVFIAWLKGKRNRKLQVQLVDGSTVYIDENDIEGATCILTNSLKVTAFDPEYNNRILNSE
ncbi:hypothetical protein [Amphritea japonica]|uniref:Uncharacterized protein n=1 Tax=Amphritea japonica ATCC BAA-1530 TaxID=1278309 RepID=A0A7R6PM37_9GAMM|nr:hypothetical protein [Amphritea japonica]BBB25948.1 hypothetical protein AMJAP_1353 [Amphritea japonica ATCC BAA-1530]